MWTEVDEALATGAGTAHTGQRVLVIDDSDDIQDLVEMQLRPEGVVVIRALDAATGLRAARDRPDLVLLDLQLPGMDGFDVCRALKEDPDLAGAPVIFLTATSDVEMKVKAFDVGATDYVTKPFDGVELRARVRAALRTKRFQDLLATRAQLDGLTAMWNRAYFDERLAEEISASDRTGRPASLVLLDLDHFKRLNDTFGHPFGDTVLRAVADAMRVRLRRGETACRYGGEEFAIILREAGADDACAVAERVRAAVAALELRAGREPVPVTASLGVASSEMFSVVNGGPGHVTAEALLAAADRALYESKRSGRNRVTRAQPSDVAG